MDSTLEQTLGSQTITAILGQVEDYFFKLMNPITATVQYMGSALFLTHRSKIEDPSQELVLGATTLLFGLYYTYNTWRNRPTPQTQPQATGGEDTEEISG